MGGMVVTVYGYHLRLGNKGCKGVRLIKGY